MPSADRIALLTRTNLVYVPAEGDTFEGLDGEEYRIHWIAGYLPTQHAFVVRVAQAERIAGRTVDTRMYALIQHTDAGEFREIEA